MEREKILAKSRRKNKDEGMEYIENQGRKIGFTIFALVFAFLAVFDLFFGEFKDFYALSALFWIFSATEGYVKYRYLRNSIYLILAIGGGVASFCSIITYVMKILG